MAHPHPAHHGIGPCHAPQCRKACEPHNQSEGRARQTHAVDKDNDRQDARIKHGISLPAQHKIIPEQRLMDRRVSHKSPTASRRRN